MSKTIPDLITLPTLGDYTAFRKIRAADWQKLVRAHNRLFGELGVVQIPGRVADEAPVWSTDSATYTQGTEGGGGLDAWCPPLTLTRYLESTDVGQVKLRAFAQYLDIRLSIVDPSTGSTVGSAVASGSASLEWIEATATLTIGDVLSGSTVVPLICYLEAKSSDGSTEGDLYQWHAHERILRSGDESLLPDGS